MKPCPLELQIWSIENALVTVYIYRPQGKFMFSEASANQSVHRVVYILGEGVCIRGGGSASRGRGSLSRGTLHPGWGLPTPTHTDVYWRALVGTRPTWMHSCEQAFGIMALSTTQDFYLNYLNSPAFWVIFCSWIISFHTVTVMSWSWVRSIFLQKKWFWNHTEVT